MNDRWAIVAESRREDQAIGLAESATTDEGAISLAEDLPAGAGNFACTIVARNYVAQARVLAGSFHSEHTASPFFTDRKSVV